MSGADAADRRAEAERWLTIVDHDIAAARLCMDASLTDVAAYHCQQATEELSKGLLVAAGIPFPKTDDLAALNTLVAPHFPALAPQFFLLEPITVWGTAYRYPPEEAGDASPSAADIETRLAEIDALRGQVSAAIATAR